MLIHYFTTTLSMFKQWRAIIDKTESICYYCGYISKCWKAFFWKTFLELLLIHYFPLFWASLCNPTTVTWKKEINLLMPWMLTHEQKDHLHTSTLPRNVANSSFESTLWIRGSNRSHLWRKYTNMLLLGIY